jgi:hypothetical protein
MTMQVVLYVVMILTVCVMIWANMQYKTKGAPWGRPLAGLCGVIALLLAVSAMVLHVIGPRMGQGKLREKEEQYQYIAHKFLGQEIATRHKGAKILMIRYSPPGTGPGVGRNSAIMSGLKDGMGTAVSIEREEMLRPQMDMTEMDMMDDPRGMLTAEKFDQIMEDNPDCTVVLSLVGLPYNIQEMKYWKKIEDEEEVPKLVLVNAHVYELKKAIKFGFISIVLQNKPTRYDWEAAVPKDEKEAFDGRFILITKDSVDELATTYPNLFAAEKK